MRYRMRGLIVAAATVILASLAMPAVASAASGPSGWQAATLPVGLQSTLTTGAAANANDVWAIGSTYGSGPTGSSQPLVIHWNGKSWSQLKATGIAEDAELFSVVAPSSTTVWVSADPNPFGNKSEAIYRLSGSKWLSVPLPAGVPDASLTSGPAGQVWAMGTNGGAVARWTGNAWQVYQTGLSAKTTIISALSFATSNNGWAVGVTRPSSIAQVPLVLHWNGTAWSSVAAPALPTGAIAGSLSSVLATTSAGVWATGTTWNDKAYGHWLVHWNGSSWTTVAMPAGFVGGPFIGNISAGDSGQPQWISGQTATSTSGYLRYSGGADGAWTFVHGVTTPGAGAYLPQLVSVPGSNTTWAVGAVTRGGADQKLEAHVEEYTS